MEDLYINGRVKRSLKWRVHWFDILVFALSEITAIAFLYVNKLSYMQSMIALPIFFGVCYLGIFAPIIRRRDSLTTKVVAVCCALRCVLLPLVVAIVGYSGFERYQTTNERLITKAVLLMCWEMLAVGLFLAATTKNKKAFSFTNRIEPLGADKYSLMLLLAAGAIVYIASPDIREYVSFLSLSSDTEKVRALTAGTQSSLITGLISFVHEAFLCLFILVLNRCSLKYERKASIVYVLISTVIGLLTVSLIFGESRATIIYTLYAVVSCLILKFPKFKTRILAIMIAGAAAIIVGMTVYRLYAVYNYASYSAAIAGGGYIREHYFSSSLESYLLGPQTVAAGLDFQNIFAGSFTIERFFYDLLRPFMGFNLFLKQIEMETSITMYNSWLFETVGRSNGVFLQITSQGYCYFGFVLAPVFTCLFIWLSEKLEMWMMKTKSLFIYFFLSYTYIRMSTCMLGGTMNDYIVTASMTLLVTLVFFGIQRLIREIASRA